MKLQFYMASLALCLVAQAVLAQTAFAQLVITEASPSPGGTNPLLAGTDWWELTNTGPGAASLDGFEWVDRPVDNNATAVFPTGISVASGESIIILRDGAAEETAFRTDWGLAASVQILREDQFTGLDQFAGLGSSSELIHLYDGAPPTLGTANLLASAPTGAAATGVTFEWGTDQGGTLGRLSVGGQHGAITLGDGRVGSPGTATVGPTGPFTVFSDTFELSTASPSHQTDVNAELALPRQHFSTSEYLPIGSAAIDRDAFGAGSGDWLALTTTSASGGAVVDLREDFGPTLAGGKYSVSYESRIDVPANATGHWQGFSIGDTAAESVNGASTDFGLLVDGVGNWQAFLDGTFVGGSSNLGIFTGIVSGQAFDIEFLFDETLASPEVTATVTATAGSMVLGTIPLAALGTGFDTDGRFIELRAFLDGATALPGDVYDHHINNLTIENLVPEPATGVMLSLVCLICAVGRRAKR